MKGFKRIWIYLAITCDGQEFDALETQNINTFLDKVNDLTQCPKYRCSPNNEDFENSVFCHKNNISDPLDVILKNCNTFNLMSQSDFFGNPIPKDSPQFCHHSLNRCVADPF